MTYENSDAIRALAQQFTQEPKYLLGVTPKTIIWYGCGFKAFEGAMESKEAVNKRIVELRDRNIQPITINGYLRVLNAFFKWNKQDIKIPKLKEEQKILAKFSAEQVNRLINWKAVGSNETRVKLITLVALDGGLRISELLGLTREQVDLDNLVLRVKGKGNKHRLVPMSVELRKSFYRYLANHNQARPFCTRTGKALSVRNSERDFKVSAGRLALLGLGVLGIL